MIVFPVISIVFFLSLMESGLPLEMPVGIVDLDNTATTRSLVRRLDAFQTTKVIARYPNIDEARHAIQRGEIYGFLYFPKAPPRNLWLAASPRSHITTVWQPRCRGR
jgi:ABC-2 type transport system permease protein